ncbi:unnamed protein product, partial [Protopolystoma xenopodis]
PVHVASASNDCPQTIPPNPKWTPVFQDVTAKADNQLFFAVLEGANWLSLPRQPAKRSNPDSMSYASGRRGQQDSEAGKLMPLQPAATGARGPFGRFDFPRKSNGNGVTKGKLHLQLQWTTLLVP